MTLRTSHRTGGRLHGVLAVAVLLWTFEAILPARAVAGEEQQRAVLDLVVNDVGKGQVTVLVRDRDVLVAVEDLEKSGVRGFGGRRETVGDRVFVSLASLAPEMTYQVDERALSLRLVAAPRLLGFSRIDLKRGERQEFSYSATTSAFVNYGLNWRQNSGYQATAEAGVNMRGALAASIFTWDESGSLVRGMSSLSFDNRVRLRRVVLGDSVVSDRLLGGSLFLGGVRVAREYSIDPYFIQYPMLGLSGAVTSPSTIEVYVDGRLVRQERLQPGQFELANVPVTNGATRTQLVIRDAFGRQQEVSAPYYLTNAVLAKGLDEYEYALGFPRQNVAISSAEYGRLSLFARHRYGFSDLLTAGLRLEARAGMASGGPSIEVRLPFGEAEMAAAASGGAGRHGGAVLAGYSYSGHPVSGGLTARVYSREYETLSSDASRDRSRYEVAAFVGTKPAPSLGVTLQFARSETYGGREVTRGSAFVNGRLTSRAYAFASAGMSSANGQRGFEGSVGMNVALGGRTGLTLSVARRSDGEVDAGAELHRSLPVGEGIGYRLRAGDGTGASGLLLYRNRFAHVEAGNQTVAGTSAANVSVAGGLVAIGGAVFATRPVQDGFALVRVPGVRGVQTYLSNQPVGRTNARGDILVPSLLPYYANRVRIEDNDVPIDHAVERTEYAVAPPFRGGALVVFPATRMRSIWGTVRVEVDGQWVVPAYGEVTVDGQGRRVESPVGRDGEFYLENLGVGAHTATVRYHGLACNITVNVPDSSDPVASIGEMRCSLGAREKRP